MPFYSPINFSQVDDNLYRSAWPNQINFSFLKSLSLKTIIALSADNIDDKFREFLASESIKLFTVSDSQRTSVREMDVSEEMVTAALRIVLNDDNLPALITCTTGTNVTGVVVGCLRKLKRWSLISIYEEYRRFSGTVMQQQYEQFIELFDNELVSIPQSNTESR